jgi:hypothetical protein
MPSTLATTGNFDMIRESGTKLLDLGFLLTGLSHKRFDPFILFLVDQLAGDPPLPFKKKKKKP